jgi:membrane protease YdiL (CAAX protease family)
MTVQPLATVWIVRQWFDRGPVDLGLRSAPARLHWLALVVALILTGVAMAIAFLLQGESGAISDLRLPLDGAFARASTALVRIFGFVGMVCILWAQALAEEVGWRGYLLPRLMRALGPFPGLFAHGALWGLWYAPVLLLCSASHLPPITRCAAFVVTCSLLGVLLGWIRIISRSVIVSATTNGFLTMAASLPLVLQGQSAPRSAIYLPAGWVPLALGMLVLLAARQRAAIADFVRRS